MAQRKSFTVVPITGLNVSATRGIAFLVCTDDSEINARAVYEGVDAKIQRTIRNRFDYWLQGGIRDEYFHGWNDLFYRELFCFKWREKGQRHRFYGFLVNPRPRTVARFQVCVLVSHAQKNTWETDPARLNQANTLRQDRDVMVAVKRAYPETDLQ